MIENNEEKLAKPPTFSFICFVTMFFFMLYFLSIILFIGLFPIMSDFIMNLIVNINMYQILIVSAFLSILTVFYFVVKDIHKIHEQLKKLGVIS